MISWCSVDIDLQPVIEAGIERCPICGPRPVRLRMQTTLSVGLGEVIVTRNGAPVWCGDSPHVTVSDIERLAQSDTIVEKPDFDVHSDWRIRFYAPLSDRTYQRQGKRQWLLISEGKGFS